MPEQPKRKKEKLGGEASAAEFNPPGGQHFEAYDYSKASTDLFQGRYRPAGSNEHGSDFPS